jgi:hypothetical protein
VRSKSFRFRRPKKIRTLVLLLLRCGHFIYVAMAVEAVRDRKYSKECKSKGKMRILRRKRHGNLELNVTKWEVDRSKCERLVEYIDVIIVRLCI